MSGFPGPEVHDILDKIWGRHEPGIAPLQHPPNPPTSTTMAQSIRYIPPQMDSAAGLSTSAARPSPIRLMLQDAGVLINNLRYLPGIVLPFKTKKKSDELYLNISGTAGIILQGSLFVIETVLLLLTFPFFLILPGGVWAAGLGVCYLAIYFLCMPIEGPAVLYSNMSKTTQALAESHKDERWLFVNGCMVG